MFRRIWNLTEIQTVAMRYPHEGPKPLAAVLKRSEDSVTGLARRYGIRSLHRRGRQAQTRALRNATINADFFDASLPVVAYVLGVLFCWGSIKTHTRHVLKLRCPYERDPVLRSVLTMMGSKHSPQRGRRRILVEIGNIRLVNSLLGRHGSLPSRDDPDPPVPAVAARHIIEFARGHLDATGRTDHREIVWSGSSNSVQAIRDAIGKATGVSPTMDELLAKKRSIGYRGPLPLVALRRWLSATRPAGE